MMAKKGLMPQWLRPRFQQREGQLARAECVPEKFTMMITSHFTTKTTFRKTASAYGS